MISSESPQNCLILRSSSLFNVQVVGRLLAEYLTGLMEKITHISSSFFLLYLVLFEILLVMIYYIMNQSFLITPYLASVPNKKHWLIFSFQVGGEQSHPSEQSCSKKQISFFFRPILSTQMIFPMKKTISSTLKLHKWDDDQVSYSWLQRDFTLAVSIHSSLCEIELFAAGDDWVPDCM